MTGSRVVVLGTGTGVGKTHVSVALGRSVARMQPARRVALLKPIETGFEPGASSDAGRLEAEIRGFSRPEPHPRFAFEAPISPHLAARRAGRSIEIAEVVAWLEQFESSERAEFEDLVAIETAGGVFTPLSDRCTNLDLACALEPAIWLLVAPDALGVLHELGATLGAMERRGRAPDLVVLTAARAADESTGTNAEELRRLGIADPIATLTPGSYDLRALVRRLAAGKHSRRRE